MKKKIFGTSIISLYAMSATLAGCSFMSGSDVSEETTISSEVAETETTTEKEVINVSNDAAKAAGQALFEEMVEYVRNDDRESYKSICKFNSENEDIEKTISDDFNAIKNYILDNYPYSDYFIIDGDGQCFGFGVLNSIVAGQFPNTDSKSHNFYCPISFDGDRWYLDWTSETYERINKATMYLYPDEAKLASEAGRNCVDMSNGSDYTWTNPTVTIPGTLDTKLYLIWQNEDGSIGVMVNIKNGTDQARAINYTTITVTDEELGEILDVNVDGDIIPAKTSKNYIYTISADKVKTGMQQWGYVGADTSSHW